MGNDMHKFETRHPELRSINSVSSLHCEPSLEHAFQNKRGENVDRAFNKISSEASGEVQINDTSVKKTRMQTSAHNCL